MAPRSVYLWFGDDNAALADALKNAARQPARGDRLFVASSGAALPETLKGIVEPPQMITVDHVGIEGLSPKTSPLLQELRRVYGVLNELSADVAARCKHPNSKDLLFFSGCPMEGLYLQTVSLIAILQSIESAHKLGDEFILLDSDTDSIEAATVQTWLSQRFPGFARPNWDRVTRSASLWKDIHSYGWKAFWRDVTSEYVGTCRQRRRFSSFPPQETVPPEQLNAPVMLSMHEGRLNTFLPDVLAEFEKLNYHPIAMQMRRSTDWRHLHNQRYVGGILETFATTDDFARAVSFGMESLLIWKQTSTDILGKLNSCGVSFVEPLSTWLDRQFGSNAFVMHLLDSCLERVHASYNLKAIRPPISGSTNCQLIANFARRKGLLSWAYMYGTLNYLPVISSYDIDLYVVAGEGVADRLASCGFDLERLRISGLPKYDEVIRTLGSEPPEATRERLELDSARPVWVCFLTDRDQAQRNDHLRLLRPLGRLASEHGAIVVAKFHPGQEDWQETGRFLQAQLPETDLRILIDPALTVPLLRVADLIVIDHLSTVMMEAAMFSTAPTAIYVHVLTQEVQENFGGAFAIAEGESALTETLRRLCDEPSYVQALHSARQQLLYRERHLQDGRAGERIAGHVHDALQARQPGRLHEMATS